MAKFERQHVYTFSLQPDLWRRFTDCIFLIKSHGLEAPQQFMNNFNIVHPNLIIYIFNLRPGVLIKTLSHKWGKLNLPTLLFKVGLLTLINMDSIK